MRPIFPKRPGRSLLVLQKEEQNKITAGIRETGAILSIPRKNILPGLKTHAYVNKYDIGSICDWMIQDNFDGFEKVCKLTASKKIDFDNVYRQASKRISHLFLCRRMDFAAAGTRVLSFYSDSDMVPGKAFWSILTNQATSKTYCIWLNSIVSIVDMFLNRTETRGTWCELTEMTVLGLHIPTLEFISKEKHEFLRIFKNYKSVEWPSLIEQLKGPLPERRIFDEEIFGVLGVGKREVNKILPDLYRALADELVTLKRAMGSAGEMKEDSQLDLDIE
jgi:hypothetical protein